MDNKQKFKNFVLFKYPIISPPHFPRVAKSAKTNLLIFNHTAKLIKDYQGEMGVEYKRKHLKNHHKNTI